MDALLSRKAAFKECPKCISSCLALLTIEPFVHWTLYIERVDDSNTATVFVYLEGEKAGCSFYNKDCLMLIRPNVSLRYASVFLQPVSDDIAPGYHSIVHRLEKVHTHTRTLSNTCLSYRNETKRCSRFAHAHRCALHIHLKSKVFYSSFVFEKTPTLKSTSPSVFLLQTNGPVGHKEKHRVRCDPHHSRVPARHHADVSERRHVQLVGPRRLPHGSGDAARRPGARPAVPSHPAHHADLGERNLRQEPSRQGGKP